MNADTTAVTILIEIHAKPGREAEARDALRRAIRTSAKPGMVGSREFADDADSRTFHAIQEWDSEQAFRAHMSEVSGGMSEATAMLSRPPRTAVLRRLSG